MTDGKIFISYRRADTSGYAGRLFDQLSDFFGKENVFMDIKGIGPGADFHKALHEAVSACDVLIALIGNQWLDIKGENGLRRLDDPEDFVRIEIAAALERDILVIPVLVQGAHMPGSKDLPQMLQQLARRHALEIRHESFEEDVDRLARGITKYIEEDGKQILTWKNLGAAFPQEKLSQLRIRLMGSHSAYELKRIQYDLQKISVDFPNHPDVLELQDDLKDAIAYHTFLGRSKTFVRQNAGAISIIVILIVALGIVFQTKVPIIIENIAAAFPFMNTSTATSPAVAVPPTYTTTPTITPTDTFTPTPTFSATPTFSITPTPSRTPTPTLTPPPLACGHIKIPSYVFPRLVDVGFEYAFWGYSGDSNEVFKCEGVYDRKHNTDLAVRIEYSASQDSDEFGYFGISTRVKEGVDISAFSEVCLWAYANQPDQSFWLKIKDVRNKEGEVAVSVEDINDWSLICVDLSEYSGQNVDISKLENINLGFDKGTGSAMLWVDDFELR